MIATTDDNMHALLTRRLTPDAALAAGAVALEGDASALPRLLDLFEFPALEPAVAP